MENTVITDPSMADLRQMLASETTSVAKPETATAEEVVAKEPIEAVSETADKKQNPTKSDDEDPLPEGVQKKIAKEAERAARAQSAIDRAVSERKAKEAEAQKLTKSGSAPVPTPVVNDAKPTKPEFGKDGQTWGEYQAALATYETAHEAYLLTETRKTVEQEFSTRQAQTAAKERWDAAVKVHGPEFGKLMETATATAPVGLQQAISALDDWSSVAVHLAKNPARLAEVVAKFESNPYAAVAELGRIEASLKSVTKAADPLPKPPVVEGGKSSASAGAFDWEAADMSKLRQHLNKLGKR